VRKRLYPLWQAFLSFDAVLLVLAYTVLLLVVPIPKTKMPVVGR